MPSSNFRATDSEFNGSRQARAGKPPMQLNNSNIIKTDSWCDAATRLNTLFIARAGATRPTSYSTTQKIDLN